MPIRPAFTFYSPFPAGENIMYQSGADTIIFVAFLAGFLKGLL